jgi:hypothetical protein
MIKKVLLLSLLVFLIPFLTQGQEVELEQERIVIDFFDDRLCSVCRETKSFIEEKALENPLIELNVYPITDTEELYKKVEHYGIKNYKIMSPTIFITSGESFNFFQFRDFTSRQEESLTKAIQGETVEEDCCMIKVPFLGVEIDIGDWSLILISVILGSLDGFNVCSLGALILILSIVLVLDSRKKIFLYGGIFILTTVVTYGVLVFAWGKLFGSLIGHLEILRIIVGLAALGGGIYFLKEFWKYFKHGPTCESSKSSLFQKATARLQNAFKESKGTFFITTSIILFAVVITIIELPCSIGVPIAFTGILIENSLSSASYFFHILIYLFFYMIDEFLIFFVAVFTKKIWLKDSKAITWITLVGAIIMFYLAFYYLFS